MDRLVILDRSPHGAVHVGIRDQLSLDSRLDAGGKCLLVLHLVFDCKIAGRRVFENRKPDSVPAADVGKERQVAAVEGAFLTEVDELDDIVAIAPQRMLGHKAVTPKAIYVADRMVRAALGCPTGSSGNFAGAACQRPHCEYENLSRRRHDSLPKHEQDTHGLFVLSGHC